MRACFLYGGIRCVAGQDTDWLYAVCMSTQTNLRIDGRAPSQLRPISFETGVQMHAAGSVIVSMGDTRVLCAVTIEESVPRFLRGTGSGWVTAEYNMLPASTNTRSNRERALSSGRTKEIQRLIGRSLRAVVDLDALGERSFNIDCDVLQADGGTRTASITGAWLALQLAIDSLGAYQTAPLKGQIAAVSVGIVGGQVLVDLCYEEDAAAEVDLNYVGVDAGGIVEVQGTAEGAVFTRSELDQMLDAADAGLRSIFAVQREALRAAQS